MSNTLETKTIEQLNTALLSYNSHMCDIPDIFTVLGEHLLGMTQTEFCGAFRALQNIIVDIYNYLRENPQIIGLVKPDKKTGELSVQTSQHISCVKKLLYVIGRFSEIEETSLVIEMGLLMNAYMTYYSNCSVELAVALNEYSKDKQDKFFDTKQMRSVFDCLEEFGFEFDGLNKENNAKIAVKYPENPSILKVLKAFSLLNICRVSFGFDFTKLNYRVFAHETGAKIPLEDLYSFNMLSDAHKEFLSCLNEAMTSIGSDYGECASGWYHGTQPCQYIYKNKVRIMQNVENGLMPYVVVRFGKKADKVIEFIESLPDEYKGNNGRCSGCRKGDCSNRVIASSADKKYALCKVAWWSFPPTVDAVPYIIGAYKI
ncbi:hypothetical protein LJB90_00495 [Eubacteriales bacterium OttesenSCG-928-G02]|nr:hypothetical protein [Eubacteriales bacterium OttesenSCG-928-G02]